MTFDNKVINVDLTLPRTFKILEDHRFDFGQLDKVSVDVAGAIYAFKWQENEKRTTVSKYQDATEGDEIVITQLPDVP